MKIDSVDGIAMADIFHYKLFKVQDIRNSLIDNGIKLEVYYMINKIAVIDLGIGNILSLKKSFK